MGRDFLNRLSDFNLGFDLGSSFVKVFAEGKGVLFFEPTAIARRRKRNGPIIGIGKRAQVIIGKEPRNIEVVEPIEHGVIADFDSALGLSKHLFSLVRQTPGRRLKLLGPQVVVGASCQTTEVERRALKAVLIRSGARKVFLVEKTLASAFFLNFPIEKSEGFLIVDLGGGSSEMAVLSLGGIVLQRFLPIGGKEIDEAIIGYLRLKYGILIGRLTAERIKKQLGSVSPRVATERFLLVVRGRDLATGLPKSIQVKKGEIMEALLPLVQKIILSLKELLEEIPAELMDSIFKRGIVLVGGSAQIPGWEELIKEETGLSAFLVNKPQETVVRGCGALLNNRSLLNRVKLTAGLQ